VRVDQSELAALPNVHLLSRYAGDGHVSDRRAHGVKLPDRTPRHVIQPRVSGEMTTSILTVCRGLMRLSVSGIPFIIFLAAPSVVGLGRRFQRLGGIRGKIQCDRRFSAARVAQTQKGYALTAEAARQMAVGLTKNADAVLAKWKAQQNTPAGDQSLSVMKPSD
jgi:hypothetical protein